jgi:hypothetical protein
MRHKWYNNDWFLSFMAAATFALAAVGNYYIHGGHIVW